MIINLDFIYPVGSIYISVNSTSPSVLFGGTWEQIQGRFLLGAGTPSQNTNTSHGTLTDAQLTWNFVAGQTLGEYYHQLNTSEMPSHSHMMASYWSNAGTTAGDVTLQSSAAQSNWWAAGCQSSGGDLAHNNIPPSLTVYMWKRIS